MIDRIAFWIFDKLDKYCEWVDNIFVKPKKKKKKKQTAPEDLFNGS